MRTVRAILIGFVALLIFYGILQEFRVIGTESVIEPRAVPGDGEPATLRFLTRSGYFNPEFLAEVEKHLALRLEVSLYDSDDECLTLIEAGDSWDLMLVPDHVALRLDRLNRTYDIDYERIPNHRNMVLGARAPREMGALYRSSVPFFYTTVGMGYNASFISSIPLRWDELFAPADPAPLRGRIGLLNDSRRSLGTALLALGKSPNSRNPDEIRLAAEHVKRCMSLLPTMDRDTGTSHGGANLVADEMTRRKVVLSMITSAAMAKAMKTHEELRFSTPTDGALLCIDSLVIPRSVANRSAAEDCINYLLQPAVSARLTNESGFATTNEAAGPYVASGIRHGPAFAMPSGRQLFYLQDLEDAEQLYRKAWLEILEYYNANVAPALDRAVGFQHGFIEGNDSKP